jgi:hypothetical protein
MFFVSIHSSSVYIAVAAVPMFTQEVECIHITLFSVHMHAVLSLFEAQCAELHNHQTQYTCTCSVWQPQRIFCGLWCLCRMISTLPNACNVLNTTFAYSGSARKLAMANGRRVAWFKT